MVSNDIIQAKRIAVEVINALAFEERIRFTNIDINSQETEKNK